MGRLLTFILELAFWIGIGFLDTSLATVLHNSIVRGLVLSLDIWATEVDLVYTLG